MDAMIDLGKEEPITLTEFGRQYDKHYNTVYRWWKKGIAPDRSKPKRRIKLETVILPHGRATTHEAYQRFVDKLTEFA